jgi:glycosyltransferase involved in cell wall biosynthesis
VDGGVSLTSLAPRASIVIATYNRADRLSACLAALADQSQPAADFEVVVVVDG